MPKQLLNDGFKGDVDVFSNSITFTIIHPSADLQKVKESLEITLKDIELRLKRGNSSIIDTDDEARQKPKADKGLKRLN